MAKQSGIGGPVVPESSADAQRGLQRRRRKVFALGGAMILMCIVVISALTALAFSADRKAWNDESRVLTTQGTVVDEVRSSRGSCKGADYDTLIEWTQDDETRSAWTSTCRSGPDVGDQVDLWVRDDGEITLTAPSATVVFTVMGIVLFVGFIVMSIFATRAGLRGLAKDAAPSGANRPASGADPRF